MALEKGSYSMKLTTLSILLALSATAGLTASCSATDGSGGAPSAGDVADQPAPGAAKAPPPPTLGNGVPAADRLRELDKTVYKMPVDGLPVIGNPQALVTIVLFSDYECPFCKKLDADLQRLREEWGGDVRIVVAQRPLPFHLM